VSGDPIGSFLLELGHHPTFIASKTGFSSDFVVVLGELKTGNLIQDYLDNSGDGEEFAQFGGLNVVNKTSSTTVNCYRIGPTL
jgi:hypothetical protein